MIRLLKKRARNHNIIAHMNAVTTP